MRKHNKSYLPRTWAEVMRFFGSCASILRTRSLALLDMLGHGWLSKSIWPCNIASNIPFSVSTQHFYEISRSSLNCSREQKKVLGSNKRLLSYYENQSHSLPAQNGGTPLSKIYNMTPALHISISFPYLRRRTSGAT